MKNILVTPQTTFWEFADKSGTSRVHFIDKQEHHFVSNECESFEILNSHPVLMDYDQPWVSIYVSSSLPEPESIWAELKEVVRGCAGPWRMPKHYFNPQISSCEILRSGVGMLATAPIPLARQFTAILVKANIFHTILPNRSTRSLMKALVAGTNFVVARDYKIERL